MIKMGRMGSEEIRYKHSDTRILNIREKDELDIFSFFYNILFLFNIRFLIVTEIHILKKLQKLPQVEKPQTLGQTALQLRQGCTQNCMSI